MECSHYGLLVKPSLGDYINEKIITIVPFFTALFALFTYSNNLFWPLLYLGIIAGHMTHILLRRCPHCAYYKTGSEKLSCLWWRWTPKLRKRQEGPPPGYLRIYTPIMIMIITLFPVYWLLKQWELMVIYALSWTVLFISIVSTCSRCIDFECRFNSVPDEVRDSYQESTRTSQ